MKALTIRILKPIPNRVVGVPLLPQILHRVPGSRLYELLTK